MTVLPNPKELDAIFKICRKQGVTDLEIGAIKVKFGELPRKDGELEEAAQLPGQPSQEDLLYWSAQPDPLAQREESA